MSKKVGLNDVYNMVSRVADTAGTSINAAETRRVLSAYHSVLAQLPSSDALALVVKGMSGAEKVSSKSGKTLLDSARSEVEKLK